MIKCQSWSNCLPKGLTSSTVLNNISRMTNMQREADSLDDLHEQSVELILHAHRLRQEFTQLREASRLLRSESIQLRDDCRTLRNMARLFT